MFPCFVCSFLSVKTGSVVLSKICCYNHMFFLITHITICAFAIFLESSVSWKRKSHFGSSFLHLCVSGSFSRPIVCSLELLIYIQSSVKLICSVKTNWILTVLMIDKILTDDQHRSWCRHVSAAILQSYLIRAVRNGFLIKLICSVDLLTAKTPK